MRALFPLPILVTLLIGPPAKAAEAPTQIIQGALDAYVGAWARADAAGIGKAYADDGEFINPSGDRFVGPSAIAGFYAMAFSRGYAGSHGAARISEARAITEDVLLARGDWSITGARIASGPIPPECGTFDLLMRRDQDRWSVVFLHEIETACPASGAS
jgi:uncharacterized protein (TIGR02246 family)